jgi:hypothetical protein
MVQIDPTEAIHSELILEVLRRYFRIDEIVPVGGAIAYPILTHNANLFAMDDIGERERLAQLVLDEDNRYLERHPEASLFAYATGQPDKAVLGQGDELRRWEREEDERERAAESRGGEYYDRSLIQELYLSNDRLTTELQLTRQGEAALRDQLAAIHGSFLYSHLTRLLAQPAVRRVLQHPAVRRVVQRLRSRAS